MVHPHVEEEESMTEGDMTLAPHLPIKTAILSTVEVEMEVATTQDLLLVVIIKVVMALLVVGIPETLFLRVEGAVVEVEVMAHRPPKHPQNILQVPRVEGIQGTEARVPTLMEEEEEVAVVAATLEVVLLIQQVVVAE